MRWFGALVVAASMCSSLVACMPDAGSASNLREPAGTVPTCSGHDHADPSTASTYLRLALDRFGAPRVGRAWLGPGPDGVTTIYLDLADPSTRDRWAAERLRHRAGTGYPVEVVAAHERSSPAALPPCARPIRL